ncbi:MAG: phosphotransferase [Pseudomonadota bacterium]
MTNQSHLDFLSEAGWAGAEARPLAGDASTRRYLRVSRNGNGAVLMIAPPGAESAPCPLEASVAERQQLGYNATARLAGPNLNAFIAIGNALRAAGLSAPEIYAADAKLGLALIEDLGDSLFARVVDTVDETEIYSAAVDVLAAMRAQPPARPATSDYAMLDYDHAALLAETELLIDWYWPLKKGGLTPDDLKAEYLEVFSNLLKKISPPHSLVLRDFHAENLLWLPDRKDVKRVGLIDFQDGLFGAAAYDLVSLLEDARRDVEPGLAAAMVDRYCGAADKSGDFDRGVFLHDYSILAAQRNAKILGIFARLAKRDNKPRYLGLLPRVEAHFRGDLKRPGMELLHRFIADHLPELAL